jgi:hypothetical protein
MTAVLDYYQVLHVPPGASPEAIQRAFRALVRQYHPDRNAGDEDAAEITKSLIEAHKVLLDPERRFAYDQLRMAKLRAKDRAEKSRKKQQDDDAGRVRKESERRQPSHWRGPKAMAPARPRACSYTRASCVSLAALAQRMRAWDHLPQFIQGLLKQSVLIALAVNLICIPVFWLLPKCEWLSSPVPPNGFFLWFTADAVNLFLRLTREVAPWLLGLNIASLVLTLLVVVLSWGFRKRVHEAVHWLAWSAAFPSGASVLSAIILAGLLLGVVLIALVMWIIIITLVILFVCAVLGALAGAAR